MASTKKKTTAKKTPRRVTRRRDSASAALPGMTAATPGFTVADIRKSVAWYRDVLGFGVNERWETNGRLEAVEMRSGSVSFFLGQDDGRKGRSREKGQGVRIYCSTGRNVDAFAKHVRGQGTPLTQTPTTEMGMRCFSVDDPDGYQITIWAVSQR